LSRFNVKEFAALTGYFRCNLQQYINKITHTHTQRIEFTRIFLRIDQVIGVLMSMDDK